jgi:RimJ/RimL family protein N-acetyltransferase
MAARRARSTATPKRTLPKSSNQAGDLRSVVMHEIVRLTDGVVELRPWTSGNAAFLLEACRDADIRRFWLRQPLETLDEATAMIEAFAASWGDYQTSGTMKGLAFVIADVVSGAPFGLCGVDDWYHDDAVQIGYFLDAAGRGKGYATRAVRLLNNWLFDLGAAKVFATAETLNVASIAVLHRAGFAHETTRQQFGTHDGKLYELAVYTWAPDSDLHSA